jgi:hypothetical protein
MVLVDKEESDVQKNIFVASFLCFLWVLSYGWEMINPVILCDKAFCNENG